LGRTASTPQPETRRRSGSGQRRWLPWLAGTVTGMRASRFFTLHRRVCRRARGGAMDYLPRVPGGRRQDKALAAAGSAATGRDCVYQCPARLLIRRATVGRRVRKKTKTVCHASRGGLQMRLAARNQVVGRLAFPPLHRSPGTEPRLDPSGPPAAAPHEAHAQVDAGGTTHASICFSSRGKDREKASRFLSLSLSHSHSHSKHCQN
jgi:hypothetical protein